MHIGILQTGHAPEDILTKHGNYDAMFHALFAGENFTFTTWPVVDMVFPQSVEDAEAWLITGSRYGAYDDCVFISALGEFIREVDLANKRLVGICFGHQVVAQALGGRVEKFEGGWTVGRFDYDFQGEIVRANAIHQDQVIDPPKRATVVATHPRCQYAGLAYGDNIFTVQPHPEITDPILEDYIRVGQNSSRYPMDTIQAAHAMLHSPSDASPFTRRLAQTLKGAT